MSVGGLFLQEGVEFEVGGVELAARIILDDLAAFGDAVTRAGEPRRDKTVGTCFAKFDSVANFRGEPSILNMDQILIYPNADGSVPSVDGRAQQSK